MSRMKSTPTTIRVQAKISLASEARATASNTFRVFAGGGLNDLTTHPSSGCTADATEDGQKVGDQCFRHTIVDWCGKGVYDPITRRAQWMGKGTGNSPGGYVYNVLAIYDEVKDSWSARRGFKSPGQSAATFGIGHTYDNNCIDVRGRRHYKKQFNEAGGGSGKFYVYNLDSDTFETGFPGPRGDPGSNSFGPADFIPPRGAQGSIWYAHGTNSNSRTMLSEYSVSLGSWATLAPQGTFPAFPRYMGSGGVMSYNPRAFGGVGGVLLGGASQTVYMIRADATSVNLATTVMEVAGAPIPVGFGSGGSHLCRDPSGSGWLLFVGSGGLNRVYHFDRTTWTAKAVLPPQLPGNPFIVIPIDDYGVVWLIKSRPSDVKEPRAWLYKP